MSRGDRVILREGDRVPADGVVVETSNLAVDESLLTGESVPVEKAVRTKNTVPDSRSNVYSGTLVVRGAGVAHVIATGIRTELGRIGATLSRVEIGQTSLQLEVRRIVRFLVIAGLIVCGVVAIVDGINRHQWLDGLLAGLTVAISLVPEEFPVVLTVFLALGAWRISRNPLPSKPRILASRWADAERMSRGKPPHSYCSTTTSRRSSVPSASDDASTATSRKRCRTRSLFMCR